MNKYFENETKLKKLKKEIKALKDIINFKKEKIENLKDLCDHTTLDGKNAITWENDRGHGHITYTCGVCGRWGDRGWYNENKKD